MAASVVDYSSVAQPNRSLVREALLGVVAVPAQLSILNSSASTPARARPVLPFIVCERSLPHPPFAFHPHLSNLYCTAPLRGCVHTVRMRRSGRHEHLFAPDSGASNKNTNRIG
jgi:hypothetical protein